MRINKQNFEILVPLDVRKLLFQYANLEKILVDFQYMSWKVCVFQYFSQYIFSSTSSTFQYIWPPWPALQINYKMKIDWKRIGNVLGTIKHYVMLLRYGPQISLYKVFDWFIIISSTIWLVQFKICLKSSNRKSILDDSICIIRQVDDKYLMFECAYGFLFTSSEIGLG